MISQKYEHYLGLVQKASTKSNSRFPWLFTSKQSFNTLCLAMEIKAYFLKAFVPFQKMYFGCETVYLWS